MATDKRRTLWDRLTGQNQFVANEDKFYNPFKVRIGNTLHIDTLDFRGPMYTIKKFDVVDRNTGISLADYHLTASVLMGGKPIPDEKKNLILRTVPRDGATGKSKIDFRIVALSLYFECAWDDESRVGIMEGVNDPAGEFVINAGTTDERKFWRLGGLKQAESATITTVKDADGDVSRQGVEIWGFSRTTQDEAKQDVNEYLYVQKDTDTGWLQIFTGKEIPPERINV